MFVNLKDSTPPRAVPDDWYQVRKKIGDIRGDLPQGVEGPGFDDEFGDTYGIVYAFTADGFSQRELRDYVEDVRSRLLQTPDVSKIDVVGAQDERVYVEYSTSKLAALGVSPAAMIDALQAQNAVTPAGVVQTGEEELLVRVSGAFRSERDLLAVNFVANGRLIRLGDIAEVKRGYADPPQPLFRVNGQRRSRWRSPCATAATSSRSASISTSRCSGSPPTCRLASSRSWSPTRRRRSIARSATSWNRCGRRSPSCWR